MTHNIFLISHHFYLFSPAECVCVSVFTLCTHEAALYLLMIARDKGSTFLNCMDARKWSHSDPYFCSNFGEEKLFLQCLSCWHFVVVWVWKPLMFWNCNMQKCVFFRLPRNIKCNCFLENYFLELTSECQLLSHRISWHSGRSWNWLEFFFQKITQKSVLL